MKQKDVIRIANEKGVPKSTIDKDWVLGHFLNAMYSFGDIRENFIFKGGTCLHKCFYDDYRFSEDLDFTLLNKEFVVDQSFINKIIRKAQGYSAIQFYVTKVESQIHRDIPQGYKVEIKFWGADHNPNQRPLPASRWQTGIHLDISFSEQLVLPSVVRQIKHPYPDVAMVINEAVCYDLKELVAEKIRALLQRNRPRDIYDVWFLGFGLPEDDLPVIKNLLFEKSHQKNLTITGVDDFVNPNKYQKNSQAWSNSIAHQVSLNNLPGFDIVYQQLEMFLKKLFNIRPK